MSPRALVVVLDGVGVGALPDAASYGDAGANTLGNVLEAARPGLPNLSGLGLLHTLYGEGMQDKGPSAASRSGTEPDPERSFSTSSAPST